MIRLERVRKRFGAHEVLRLDLASGKLTRLPIGE